MQTSASNIAGIGRPGRSWFWSSLRSPCARPLGHVKTRSRARRDITGIEYDQGQRDLHNEWQTRRVDLARQYVYTFADARLKDIQEEAYEAARAAADAVWEREGAALILSYAMPEPPAWASQPEQAEDDKPARRRAAR